MGQFFLRKSNKEGPEETKQSESEVNLAINEQEASAEPLTESLLVSPSKQGLWMSQLKGIPSKSIDTLSQWYSTIDNNVKKIFSRRNATSDDYEELHEQIKNAIENYESRRDMKWVVTVVGFFTGVISAFVFIKIISTLFLSAYDRQGVERVMKDLIGSRRYNEIISDELLVISYDYNNQEPRFFSKTFQARDPLIYNVTLGNSTAASSAAPTFFDPKPRTDGYGLRELQIDGGIIANNPALNAYTIAHKFRKHNKIRVVSLGTGEKPFKKHDASKMEKIDFMGMFGEFSMNMDTYTVEWYLN